MLKSVHIWSYSGTPFLSFVLNTERYSVSLRIESEYGKMRTRITLNRDTFYAVNVFQNLVMGKIPYLNSMSHNSKIFDKEWFKTLKGQLFSENGPNLWEKNWFWWLSDKVWAKFIYCVTQYFRASYFSNIE